MMEIGRRVWGALVTCLKRRNRWARVAQKFHLACGTCLMVDRGVLEFAEIPAVVLDILADVAGTIGGSTGDGGVVLRGNAL